MRYEVVEGWEQLPKGYRMHINWGGDRGSVVFGGCDEPSSFDPGGTLLTRDRRAAPTYERVGVEYELIG